MNLELRTVIYTTQKRKWIQREFNEIYKVIGQAKGVTVFPFTVKHIDLPDDVPTYAPGDGGIYIDWSWLAQNCPVGDHNALCLHISSQERDALGLRHPEPDKKLGGAYDNDRDRIFDFVVIANEKGRSYDGMSRFMRIFLHELSHGFSHWLGVRDLTHHKDYVDKDIKAIYATYDFRPWSILKAVSDVLQKLAELKHTLSKRAVYPVNGFVKGVTQKWGVESDLYMSGYHFGLDVTATYDEAIRAPHDGRVYLSGFTPQLGYYVFYETFIDGRMRWYLFPHLRRLVAEGEYKKGQTIGNIGTTGLTTGVHCHIGSFRVKPASVAHYVSLVDTKEKGFENTIDPYKEFRWLVDNVLV